MHHERFPLSAIRPHVERVDQILDLLQEEKEPAVRADLADELVQECSLLEDADSRVLYPFLKQHGEIALAARLAHASDRLRDAMEPIYQSVKNTTPINVHVKDPQGFESRVARLTYIAREQLEQEYDELPIVIARLSADERGVLEERLEDELQHAVPKPHPPQHPVGRFLSRVVSTIDRRAPRTAEQYRPGREKA